MQVNDSPFEGLGIEGRFNSIYEIVFKIDGFEHENIGSESWWLWFVSNQALQPEDFIGKEIKNFGYDQTRSKYSKMINYSIYIIKSYIFFKF